MTGVQKGIKIAAICLAIFIICLILNAILFLVGSLSFSKGDKSFTETYEDISYIEIDLNNSELEIKYGSEFMVDASNVSDNFRIRERNDNLYIEEDSFWLFGSNGGTVTVYVPRSLNKLSIDMGIGDTLISDVIASNVEIDSGTGKTTITNSTFTDLELDTGVGEVSFTGGLYGDNSIDCGIGDISLNLVGSEEDYRLLIDKGLGDVTINGTDFKDSTYGSGNNRIEIDGGIGAIDINFAPLSY